MTSTRRWPQGGLALLLSLTLAACNKVPTADDADEHGHTAATEATRAANASILSELDFNDRQDFVDAERGLIARDPMLRVLRITEEGSSTVWDMPSYDFIKGEAPDSVNPSLWRQAQLNNIHGIFKVRDGVYQLRGYDISNMTIIEGQTGWIVVDPLTSKETAARAIAFARQHLGNKPIVAVIFTHSHVDHFGGVLGIVTAEQARQQKLRVIAPSGFMEEATSENVLAGVTMLRRSMYMYGKNLPHSPRGHIDTGLGKGTAYGTIGILAPTELITETGQELTIDGLRFVFQNTPASEAPAEMTFYSPDMKAFFGAELASHTLHNLYTLRGAKVRDALKWTGYLEEAINLFGEAEVYIGGHHWPVWGKERVRALLETQRDTFKFIHDQTLHLALQGFTPREIAEQVKLPASLNKVFSSRGYYGTVAHNTKAVYQYYFGWYDANPSNLNPLPPEASAKKYVEFMGGADAVLAKAQKSVDDGEYRWAAEILNHLVFAEPDHAQAKALLAKTYDQLGYQSESAPWRDAYLSGANELRHGKPEKVVDMSSTVELLRNTPMPRFFEAMAARLKADKAEGKALRVNFVLTDSGERYALEVKNSVLHHRVGSDPKATATLKLTRDIYLKMITGKAGINNTLLSDDLQIEGSKLDLASFFSLFHQPDGRFNIIVP